ncbi:hypothetical protein AURDEDRAFT_183791 [Auricularia subglabra TFB-10046 SS5]|nr:hypothetical protein AURDEDRAFT_183791 [Auricularia subglabra TFB-10046 SS5]
MSDASSSVASSSRSSCASDTDGTSILEDHDVNEVPADVFDKIFYSPSVSDTRGQPFELNQRVSPAVSQLGAAKDLVTSTGNVLTRIMNLYESSCCPRAETRVKFVQHSQTALLHHPDKSCVNSARPQLVAVTEPIALSYDRDVKARSNRRTKAEPPAIAWHHVLAGVLVNDGYDEHQFVDQIIDFLGALNQARPDLPGCFSLTATRTACRLWWSDAAGIYATPRLAWDDPATPSRLLNLVHRLHHPLAVDSTISLESMTKRLARYDQKPVWHVEDGLGGVYRAEHVISVGKPWTRKNWVAAATEHRSGEAQSFAPCSRVVIKDSFPLIENEAFVEDSILEHLHGAGVIPGICSPILSFLVANDGDHVRSIEVPVSGPKPRRKHRLVMRGDGDDIYQCPSVLRFIMMMYDVLEVLRYTHEQRGVLHRDISLRNVLHASSGTEQSSGCKFASQVLAHKYPELSASPSPACVLIDFDNAVWEGRSPESAKRQSVGTPAFVARNVSKEFRIASSPPAWPIPELVGSAKECYVRQIGQQAYDARSRLLNSGQIALGPAPAERAMHRPHHDAESCFWVTGHFLLTALPKSANRDNDPTRADRIVAMLESNRVGDFLDSRMHVLELRAADWAQFLHPGLRSLGELMFSLAEVVRPCFDLFQPPPPPYHLHEAMQRVLLQEACRLLDNDPLPLNTQFRRSFHSHFHDLPTALKCQAVVASRKRSAEGFDDREDGGSRPRLSPA